MLVSKAGVAFVFLSKLYRQLYAGTGISTDSARRKKTKTTARWMAKQCGKLFRPDPMPELQSPAWELPFVSDMPVPAFAEASAGPFHVVR